MSTTAHLVTARKRHRCDEYPSSVCRSGGTIETGADYVRTVAFPDGDVNTGDRPWVLVLCLPCWTAYDRPTPPRRKHRRKARA